MTTSLFGKRKFGTFKFGPTVLGNCRYGLDVDWDSNNLFDGTNEGINLNDLSIERGRKYTVSAAGDSFQMEDTGRFSAVLLDEDRRYDPFNASSPLYGYLTGGKKFRARVRTPEDSYFPLMAGVLDEPVAYFENGMNKVRLEGSDGWTMLRDQLNEVTVPLQENIYADEAIAIVLRKAGWKWGTQLDEGVDQRGYFWVDNRSAAQVIHELAHNELGSVSVNASGDLRFRSRQSVETEVVQLGDTDCLKNGIRRMSPNEVIRNMIRVISTPRSEQATQQVWELPQGQRIEVGAGETVSDIWAEFKYNNETVPVKDPVTPAATTDFDATANEDGTGTDLTGNINVTMYAFSTQAQLSVTNSGLTNAYVYVRVRGKPLAKTDGVSFQYRDEASIKQFGGRPFVLNIDQNVNVARQYLELLALFMTNARNYLIVDLLPNPEVQFAADLGDVIRANFSNYGIDQAFRVIGIKHKFHDRNGIVVNTRWWLEPYARLFTGVQLPVQLPFQFTSV